jgi:hypothetical protein
MKPDRKTESHHYVPQFYLRQWCGTDGKMWIKPVDGRSPFRASPKNFAAENGLYDTSDIPEFSALDQEGDLGAIEGLFDSRWPEVFDGTMDPATKMNISRFLALMHLRHPRVKKHVQESNSVFRRLVEMTEGKEQIEIVTPNGEIHILLKSDVEAYASDTPENIKAGFIYSMRRSIEDLATALNSRKWGVIFTKGGAPVFITGDCPLVLQRGSCTRRTFGFRTPGTVITFPISPSKMLRIGDDFAVDGLHYPLVALGDLNDAVVLEAERFVFSSVEMKEPDQPV